MEALTSLSKTELQLGQVHSLSLSSNCELIYPQVEQVLELGSIVPICTMLQPRHSALYFKNCSNIPHPQSLMDNLLRERDGTDRYMLREIK